jgi:tetratricopeptide (TPR) repeat protein
MIPGNSEHPSEEKFTLENAQAEDAITANNLPKAADILVRIIENDPMNGRAFNNLGMISWAQKKWMDAYVMFCKSVSLRPDYADALVNLFDASLKLKKAKNALPYLEKALALNPGLDEVKLLRDSIVEMGDDLYFSNRALSIGTYSPIIEEAEKQLEAGNLFKAMELYLKSNDEEGKSAAAYSGLGVISFYQQRYEDAYRLFVESLKLNPSDSETFLNLLDAAKIIGKNAEAKELFQICRKDYENLDSIAENFENIV